MGIEPIDYIGASEVSIQTDPFPKTLFNINFFSTRFTAFFFLFISVFARTRTHPSMHGKNISVLWKFNLFHKYKRMMLKATKTTIQLCFPTFFNINEPLIRSHFVVYNYFELQNLPHPRSDLWSCQVLIRKINIF